MDGLLRQRPPGKLEHGCPAPPGQTPMTTLCKLSRQQRHVSVWLYGAYLELKELQSHPGVPLGCQTADTFGVPWRLSGTRSVQASVSRSLRRLEQRGLILRQNMTSGSGEGTGECRHSKAERHNRMTHLRLLPEGIVTAKRLSADAK